MLTTFQSLNLQLISLASGIPVSQTKHKLHEASQKQWATVIKKQFKLDSRLNKKKVLSIEVGGAHDIIRPSIYRTFSELGYEIDAILYANKANDRWNFFHMTPYQTRNEIICNEYDLLEILTSDVIPNYDIVFLNTNFVYTTNRFDTAYDYKQLLQFLHIPIKSKYGCMTIAPHPCIYREWSTSTIWFSHLGAKPSLMFSADYLTSTNQTSSHNAVTTFLVSGNINTQQKNHGIVLDAAQKLLSHGVKNFQVLINGSGNLQIPEDLSQNVKLVSDNHPDELYKILRNTDFIIAGIDSQSKWQRETYGTGTCSCSLIYSLGFLKPYILEDFFANAFHFDEKSALLYSHGDLSSAMLRAINMTDNEYEKTVEQLAANRQKRREQTLSDVLKAINALKQKKNNIVLLLKAHLIYLMKIVKYTKNATTIALRQKMSAT